MLIWSPKNVPLKNQKMATEIRKRSIWVYADWSGLESPQLMGILQAELLRGREIFSFEYERDWLATSQAQILDPDLQLS